MNVSAMLIVGPRPHDLEQVPEEREHHDEDPDQRERTLPLVVRDRNDRDAPEQPDHGRGVVSRAPERLVELERARADEHRDEEGGRGAAGRERSERDHRDDRRGDEAAREVAGGRLLLVLAVVVLVGVLVARVSLVVDLGRLVGGVLPSSYAASSSCVPVSRPRPRPRPRPRRVRRPRRAGGSA